MTRICFQSISMWQLFHLLERLWVSHRSSNLITWIDNRFTVKNSGISCLALMFTSRNPAMTTLRSKNWLRNMTSHIPFFSVLRYEPRRVTVSRATWVQCQQGVETLCCPLAILHGTEPVRALTRALLGSATCAGLAHGRDYSYCILHDSLRTEVPEKAWPLFSLELSKILEKQKPTLSDSRFSLLTVTATQNGHIATESLV